MGGTTLFFKHGTNKLSRFQTERLRYYASKFVIWVILIPVTSIVLILTICYLVELRSSRFSRKPWSHNAPIVTQDEVEPVNDGKNEHISGFLRLPKTIIPSYYKLTLLPWLDVEEPYIDGNVTILIKCELSTNQITLHARNLTITNEKVIELQEQLETAEPKQVELSIVNSKEEESRHFYTILLKEKLIPGKEYQLKLDFRAEMGEDMNGFYRSSYVDQDTNTTKYLGLTQFQPTDARKAFPCFDEPQLKAIFQITIGRKAGMKSISNSRIHITRPHETMADWVWDEYEPTLPMSTYLLAVVVSEFTCQETTFGSLNSEGQEAKTLRVWSRPDVMNETDYAFEIAPKLLTYFQDYFQREYPLSKMDIVTVPEFQNGGMENWGLIIIRETELLFDPAVTSKSVQNSIASTISHEISHQWFGDLVTPRWWSDIWLNEGFASYFEYVGVTYVEPTWHKMELLVTDEMESVFDTDVLDLTRSVSLPVEDTDDIEEQFDAISYSKGASLISMVNSFLTPETFRNGLQNYLQRWKFNNTKPSDLWYEFTKEAHKDGRLTPEVTVGDIMSTWTLQRGFPIVEVTRNYDIQTALFTQSKYTLLKNGKKVRGWWVPISYASPRHNSNFSQTVPAFWMSPSDETVEMSVGVKEYDWLIVNVNATCYYRVNYDMRNWQLLSNQLKSNSSVISVLNRAQLLDDCLSLGRTSRLPYAFVLTLLEYLRFGEEAFAPWQAFLNGLQHIDYMLQLTPAHPYFHSYIRRMIRNQYSKISFNDTKSPEEVGFLNSLQEQSIMIWATAANHPLAIQRAKAYFQSSVKSGASTVPANFRKPMYRAMVEHGGETEWNFIWNQYLDANSSPSEIRALVQALACTKDVPTLSRLVDMAMTPGSDVDDDHALLVLKEVAMNPLGTHLVFNLIVTNWTGLQKRMPDISAVISVIGDQHNRPEQLEKWLLFRGKFGSELGSAQRSVYQTIEKVRSNIAWMAVNYKSIRNLFKEYLKLF